MNKRWLSVRNALVAAAFLASTGFGAFQVMAGSNTQPTTEACSAWQCAAECPNSAANSGKATCAIAAAKPPGGATWPRFFACIHCEAHCVQGNERLVDIALDGMRDVRCFSCRCRNVSSCACAESA